LASTAPEPHVDLGHAHNFLHQSEEAIAVFRQALALRPDFSDRCSGSLVYRDLGRPSTAIAALLRVAVKVEQGRSRNQWEMVSERRS
jgi:Tetratricopeptide repeat